MAASQSDNTPSDGKAEENNVKVLPVILSLFLAAIGLSSVAHAQVTIDVSKITCRQFLIGKIGTSTRSVANWLNGYYHGKQDNTIIDSKSMHSNVGELERYCRKHHDQTVMEAAKAVLGVEK